MADDFFASGRDPIRLGRREWQIDVRAEFEAIHQSFQTQPNLLKRFAGRGIVVIPDAGTVPGILVISQISVPQAQIPAKHGVVRDKASQVAEEEVLIREDVRHGFDRRDRLIAPERLESKMPRLTNDPGTIGTCWCSSLHRSLCAGRPTESVRRLDIFLLLFLSKHLLQFVLHLCRFVFCK